MIAKNGGTRWPLLSSSTRDCVVDEELGDSTSYINFRRSRTKRRSSSSRVSKRNGGSGYYSRRMIVLHSRAPENPTSLPQTAALRAPAGVALGRVRDPLAHEITCVPAFGLSVEAFYKPPQKLHTVGIAMAYYEYQFLGGEAVVFYERTIMRLAALGEGFPRICNTIALERGAERAAAGQGRSIIDRLPRRGAPNRGTIKLLMGLIEIS